MAEREEREETEQRKKEPTPPAGPDPRWTFDKEVRDANRRLEEKKGN